MTTYPLDLERTGYSYIERPNTVLLDLAHRHVISKNPKARILDVGCGAGATARALLEKHPDLDYYGVEPNAHAAESARSSGVKVFHGMLDAYVASKPETDFHGVILSDVLEHTVDPVKFMRELVGFDRTRNATFIISVPNYAVWYNRLRTLAGSFEYTWSGLYDRTHLRFFTRASLKKLMGYVGLEAIEMDATPSLVQSTAPLLRKAFFQKDVDKGDHLGLSENKAFKLYSTAIEPLEHAVCSLWPGLLGFQIVLAARRL